MSEEAQPFESSDEAQRLRKSLVERVAIRSGASKPVLDALESIPRELFMPGVNLLDVYADGPYPIGHGQTISQPTVIAMMTEAIAPTPQTRVLEIGTGCGYQAAILSKLCAHVYSIEVIEPLSRAAEQRLELLGLDNVSLRVGDGYHGWPDEAPFDAILATAAPPDVPQTLLDQLADGGRLVMPVGARFAQDLVRVTRRRDQFQRENLGAVAFVPMVHGTH